MATYYEQLNLSPQASGAEIESAIDALYNAWRQGVTHPDAVVVEEVNRNLRALEQMRVTLSDPDRRAAYDAGIGLGEASGLADPTAVLRPPHVPARTSSRLAQDASPWQCPRCEMINLPDSLHCERCGTKLADPCPKCDRITPLLARYCNRCGSDLVAARAERDRQLAQQHEAQLRDQIISLQGQIAAEQSQIKLNARLAKWWIPRPWPIIEDEMNLASAGGYAYLLELGIPFVLWVILTIVWSAAGGGNLRSLVLLLVLGVFAASVIVMLARFRKAKRKGASKLNDKHQKRIDELEQQIRQLQGS